MKRVKIGDKVFFIPDGCFTVYHLPVTWIWGDGIVTIGNAFSTTEDKFLPGILGALIEQNKRIRRDLEGAKKELYDGFTPGYQFSCYGFITPVSDGEEKIWHDLEKMLIYQKNQPASIVKHNCFAQF